MALDQSTMPVRGDECLAIFDNRDEPWVIAWFKAPAVYGEGGVLVFEQPAQPTEPIPVGSFWIDTDEVPPPFSPTIPLMSSLPTSGYDGQEIYLQNAAMAADGIVWHLRYRAASASAYKWECLNHKPLRAYYYADQFTSSAGWGNPLNPTITVPFTGIYTTQFGFTPRSGVHSVEYHWHISANGAPGAGGAVWNGCAITWQSNSGYQGGSLSITTDFLGPLTAGWVARPYGFTSNGNPYIKGTFVEIWPERLA